MGEIYLETNTRMGFNWGSSVIDRCDDSFINYMYEMKIHFFRLNNLNFQIINIEKKYTFFNKMTKGGRCMNKSTSLKRSLGVWSIVALGLGYMTPTVVFDTFGIVSRITNGLVPLAYLTALLVMILTAIS